MQIDKPLFVGRAGGEPVVFVSRGVEGFAIVRSGVEVHRGPVSDVAEGIDLFLALIERPSQSRGWRSGKAVPSIANRGNRSPHFAWPARS